MPKTIHRSQRTRFSPGSAEAVAGRLARQALDDLSQVRPKVDDKHEVRINMILTVSTEIVEKDPT